MDGTRLTGLWKNTGKDGKTFLSGSMGLTRLMVFPNAHKRGERDPDYYAWLVPAERKDGPKVSPAPLEDDPL